MWLHYDEARIVIYACMVAYRDGKLNSSNLDKAFILNGFFSWKDASVVFTTPPPPPLSPSRAFGVPWPDHFSEGGDGPELGLTVESRQKRQ